MKRGSHHTDEARSRMSLARKDKSLSHEHKAAISAALKGNKNALGHHPTDWGKPCSPETRAKISAALRGEKNPNWGKPCSPETRAKISAALRGKPGYWHGRHLSEEAKAKIGAANRVNSAGKHHSEESLRKMMLANQIKPNKQELKLQSILDEHFPNKWKFVGDGQLIIGGLCPDFANVNSKKAVIELFGDYWHQKSTRWTATELGRIMAFNSLGFKCLVIWEHELKNEENVVSKVEQFMKRGKR